MVGSYKYLFKFIQIYTFIQHFKERAVICGIGKPIPKAQHVIDSFQFLTKSIHAHLTINLNNTDVHEIIAIAAMCGSSSVSDS